MKSSRIHELNLKRKFWAKTRTREKCTNLLFLQHSNFNSFWSRRRRGLADVGFGVGRGSFARRLHNPTRVRKATLKLRPRVPLLDRAPRLDDCQPTTSGNKSKMESYDSKREKKYKEGRKFNTHAKLHFSLRKKFEIILSEKLCISCVWRYNGHRLIRPPVAILSG